VRGVEVHFERMKKLTIAGARRGLAMLLRKTGQIPLSSSVVRIPPTDVARMFQALLKRTGTGPSDVWITHTDIGHLVTYVADKVIGECVRLQGNFTEGDIGYTLRTIERLGYPVSRSTFLDIGANIGTHSLYALRHDFHRAICIEADADNFKLLRINQILNDVDHRCVNLLVALSDRDGVGKLELSPTNFGDHRLRLDPCSLADLHDERTWLLREVNIRRFDTLLEAEKIDPRDLSVAWMDIQGHEGHALSGAQALLNAGTPIVAEFWPYGLERSGGYKMFRDVVGHRKAYDLRQCMESAEPRRISVEQLDGFHQSLLERERKDLSPFMDLILL
jgi:FkbM family methyltransferase